MLHQKLFLYSAFYVNGILVCLHTYFFMFQSKKYIYHFLLKHIQHLLFLLCIQLMTIESAMTRPSGYVFGPPWIFKGSALYQLHLVKTEIARFFIPKELMLVEAFGYTLGGFFLAHYDDSPAGVFDELVVIAGTVWSPQTSCAWAARVFVSSNEACNHGRKEFGLPSHVAMFSKKVFPVVEKQEKRGHRNFLSKFRLDTNLNKSVECCEIQVSETNCSSPFSLFSIGIPFFNRWLGPVIKMSLPNFSGKTEHNPHLLKYSCQIECRVRIVEDAKVSVPEVIKRRGRHILNVDDTQHTNIFEDDETWDRSVSIMLSKPILALHFGDLNMLVEAPIVVDTHPEEA